MTTKLAPNDAARAILDAAKAHNATVTARDGIVTVNLRFTPGDKDAYIDAENAAYQILRHAPISRPGSTWGTDSGSVGGAVGLEGGYMTLNRSGVNKLVVRALNAR